jgi:hypothetical protein
MEKVPTAERDLMIKRYWLNLNQYRFRGGSPALFVARMWEKGENEGR